MQCGRAIVDNVDVIVDVPLSVFTSRAQNSRVESKRTTPRDQHELPTVGRSVMMLLLLLLLNGGLSADVYGQNLPGQ